MKSKVEENTFCPDIIFNKLDKYITQIQILDNIPVSSNRKITSRSLGLISLSEKLGQKKIEIVKDNLVLYCAQKTCDWIITVNNLQNQEILAIENLPQTKEEILIEFYGRQLTNKLKETFQTQNYPINAAISLNHGQVPYDFCISSDSTQEKIVFVGTDSETKMVFRSAFHKNMQVEVIENHLTLERLNQLCCFNS
jgi:hypothetical protein